MTAPPSASDTRPSDLPPSTTAATTQDGASQDAARADFYTCCIDLQRRVDSFLQRRTPTTPGIDAAALQRTQERTRQSLVVIREALARYSLDTLALSYNGGKDCLVLLILYLAALPAHFASVAATSTTPLDASATSDRAALPASSPSLITLPPPAFPTSLAAVYIEAPHPFPEVDAFVAVSAETYHLTLTRHDGTTGLRAAFAAYCAAHPAIGAIFVGTRRSDPHGATLGDFQATDRGWPQFLRVHPVLEWRYADIWTFLREFDVPYCSLYDDGYTSLGGKLDTHPNPALKRKEDDRKEGESAFRPAYELAGLGPGSDGDEAERWGREG